MACGSRELFLKLTELCLNELRINTVMASVMYVLNILNLKQLLLLLLLLRLDIVIKFSSHGVISVKESLYSLENDWLLNETSPSCLLLRSFK